MKTQTESFVSEIILSPTYNNQTSGNVQSPTGFFGYMSFSPNDFVIDGMDTPTEFLGYTVIALEDSNGNIEYTVFSKDYLVQAGMEPNDDWKAYGEALAETWFEAQEERYADWSEED